MTIEQQQKQQQHHGLKLELQEKYSLIRERVQKHCLRQEREGQHHQMLQIPGSRHFYHSEKYHFNICTAPKGKDDNDATHLANFMTENTIVC